MKAGDNDHAVLGLSATSYGNAERNQNDESEHHERNGAVGRCNDVGEPPNHGDQQNGGDRRKALVSTLRHWLSPRPPDHRPGSPSMLWLFFSAR